MSPVEQGGGLGTRNFQPATTLLHSIQEDIITSWRKTDREKLTIWSGLIGMPDWNGVKASRTFMRFSARAEVWVRSAQTFHSFYGPLNGGFIPISHWDGEREAECIIIPPFLLDRLTSRNPKSRRLLLRWRKKKNPQAWNFMSQSWSAASLFTWQSCSENALFFVRVQCNNDGRKIYGWMGLCALIFLLSLRTFFPRSPNETKRARDRWTENISLLSLTLTR